MLYVVLHTLATKNVTQANVLAQPHLTIVRICAFRIWTQFLWKYVYFRVISVDFNPYCTHAHCMIITLDAHGQW